MQILPDLQRGVPVVSLSTCLTFLKIYMVRLTRCKFWAIRRHSSVRELVPVPTLTNCKLANSAKRRGVFKIETIGDCYVAVTGIPEPRVDHAVAMVKFAHDMICKLDEELHHLADALGSETLGLAMRVGVHSGPVTAGVLRGEKARFQLFGDSVNTTARIESSGKPNRIHASEATANLLIQAGKTHWVKPREDTVVAKGKGELKTFWIEPRTSNNHSTHTESTNVGDDEDDISKMLDTVQEPHP